MKKMIAIGATIAMCLTLILSSAVLASPPDKAGPAQKTSGDVECSDFDGTTTWYFRVVFQAQEPQGDRDVKGNFTHTGGDDPLNLWQRFWFGDVKYANVDGNKATFAAECIIDTEGTLEGYWLQISVIDNGEPGWLDDNDGPDMIGWRWHATESAAEYAVANFTVPYPNYMAVEQGNLQVKSY